MNTIDVIHDVAHSYPGGVEALAARMGKSGDTLRKKVLPTNDTHQLTVKELRKIVDYCDTDRVAQAFADDRGLMCIKKPDFEALSDKVPEYTSDMYLATDVVTEPKMIKEFFATSIDPEADNRLLSEDYHFCKLARKNGFKIHAAPWVELTHTGTYVFSGALQRVG
jgi:hypothetical protein